LKWKLLRWLKKKSLSLHYYKSEKYGGPMPAISLMKLKALRNTGCLKENTGGVCLK
jgi:hypothetical protein